MSSTKKNTVSSSDAKSARQEIAAQLTTLLASFPSQISEKKREKNIRKASKLLSEGLLKSAPSAAPAKKASTPVAKKAKAVKVKKAKKTAAPKKAASTPVA